MRKVSNSKASSSNTHKKDIVLCPPTPPMDIKKDDKKDEDIKMEEEPKNEVIKLDEVAKPINDNVIDLDEDAKKKKKKPNYDLDDTIIKDIQLSNEVHIRLLSNINGYFIDFRKYFRGYPSQKGIRVSVGKFILACDYLKKDIDALNLPVNGK